MATNPPPLTTTVLDQPIALAPGATVADLQPPAEAIAAAGRGRTIRDRSTSGQPVPPPSAAPAIREPGLDKRLDPAAPDANRYAIGDLLGTGATSHVYAARDRTFDREVAIKFLEAGLATDGKRLARFVREARITARLDHPNIVPVYDLDVTPSGDLYLTMRKVSGRSLGEVLRQAAAGDQAPDLGDWNRRVNLMLKVCDALACAHDRGIAHQDVKPDNIMVGSFGEVVLVDWGAARPLDEEPRGGARITGTPAYMSPEQAAGSPADAVADIYCLGATLFHLLTLRHPTWAEDDTDFWAKKRAGVIDPPTAGERAHIPKRLLAIALKAMAPERDRRYASVKDVADDLHHYQTGFAVSAYQDTWLERGLRWYRANARVLWVTLAALGIAAASGLFVYGERLKEVAAWGAPIYRQEFADEGWRKDFVVIGTSAGWVRRGERLVSAGPLANFLFLPRRIHGPVAVEFEGEMQPGHPPCDLSLAWSATDPVTNPNWSRDAYLLQTGANDNTFAAIARPDNNVVMVRSPVRLVSGVRYRLRFEIDHDRLSIDLDGRRICDYRASFPCASGYIGLYAYYPGKAFDHLAIYTKGLPERIAPTAIGDSWYQRDQPLEAAEQYRLVAESFAGTRLGDEARYRQGLCLAKLGQRDAALALWRDLRDRNVASLADCQRIEWDNAAGDVAGACARFATLYRNEPELRQRLHLVYSGAVEHTLNGARLEDTDQWLALTQGVLPSEPTVDIATARALHGLGRWNEVLSRYPHIENLASSSLMALGRSAEVLTRYPHARQEIPFALFELGSFDQALREYASNPNLNVLVLQCRGRHQEALAYIQQQGQPGLMELILAGHSDQALSVAEPRTWPWYTALFHLGRLDEAEAAVLDGPLTNEGFTTLLRTRRYDQAFLTTQPRNLLRRLQANLGRWVAALERHDAAAAAALLATITATGDAVGWVAQDSWFARFILLEAARHQGDPGGFATAMRALAGRGPDWLAQRPWYAARYLLGEVDEGVFLAQPACGQAPATLLALRAVRAEFAGERAAALDHYRAYLALPLRDRRWDSSEGDPIADHYITWRVAALDEWR